jgi:hypothetical protein
MPWRTRAILPLIFLGAAAAPSGDCSSPAETGQTMPAPTDVAPTGLGGQAFAALPTPGTDSGCNMALPSITQSTTLRSAVERRFARPADPRYPATDG